MFSFVTYAEEGYAKSADLNNSALSAQAEILQLKQRINMLEKELETYKKVKPLIGKPVLTQTKNTSKKAARGPRYSLKATPPKNLSVYYEADPQTVESMMYHLETNGFIVLAKDEILQGKTVISFTSEALKSTNSFMSVLHLLVNEGEEIRVQNPSYFAAAYLQDAYHYGDFNTTLQALDSALGGMYEVKEKYELDALAEYHFMFGMPNVNDTVLLAKGDDLEMKVEKAGKSKAISYALKLPNGALLVGHSLSAKIYGYLKVINAENNAQIFPYEVMIEKGSAFMLAPKYYLALSLPQLSMTDFLKIASAPEEIANEIKKSYK